jgi:hypothetical protein
VSEDPSLWAELNVMVSRVHLVQSAVERWRSAKIEGDICTLLEIAYFRNTFKRFL